MAAEAHWTIEWPERPVEEARIFNPAFCAELLTRAVSEYHHRRQAALSIVTAFIVLPLTLHTPTREALPGRASTAFAGWAAEQATLLGELPTRALRLRPVSREALLFALHHRLLVIRAAGLLPGERVISRTARLPVSTEEVTALRRAAILLGRWFGRQHTQASILHAMGIAP